MEINTELYLSDLTSDTQDQLLEAIIERLKDDKDEVELVEAEVDADIEENEEFMDLKALTREDRIKMAIEDKAQKILENTFWGECNIGEEII